MSCKLHQFKLGCLSIFNLFHLLHQLWLLHEHLDFIFIDFSILFYYYKNAVSYFYLSHLNWRLYLLCLCFMVSWSLMVLLLNYFNFIHHNHFCLQVCRVFRQSKNLCFRRKMVWYLIWQLFLVFLKTPFLINHSIFQTIDLKHLLKIQSL